MITRKLFQFIAKRHQTLYPLCSFLFILSMNQNIFANSMEMVTAVGDDGGDPTWKVVKASPTDETHLPPGIYTRGPQQTWDVPLVQGTVLGSKDLSGLHQLTKLTNYTKRLEAFAIVDGYIRIFHVNSDLEDPDSFIKIGSEKDPVFVLTKNRKIKYNLPPITSLKDVNIQVFPMENNPIQQNILVSQRNPNAQVDDQPGITYLIQLGTEDNGTNSLKTQHPIYILDYKFHTMEELNHLKRRKGFTSLNYIEEILSKSRDDYPFWVFWKSRWMDYLEDEQYNYLPFYIPNRNEWSYPDSPQMDLKYHGDFSSVKFRYEYPVDDSRLPTLSISNGSQTKQFVGFLDFKDSVKDQFKLPNIKSISISNFLLKSQSNNFVLFYLNHQSHMIFMSDRYHFMVLSDLELGGEIPEDISIFELNNGTDTNEHHVLASFKSGNNSKTYLFQFVIERDQLVLANTITLANDFFTKEQLDERVYHSGSKFYFDHFTSTQSEEQAKAYRELYDEMAPHIDISQTLKQEKSNVGYLKCEKEHEIMEGVTYKIFKKFENVDSQDGLYLSQKDENILIQKGELLKTSGEDAPNYLEKSHFQISENETLTTAIVALDEYFEHGEDEYKIVFLVRNNQSGEVSYKIEDNYQNDFKDVHGFKLHTKFQVNSHHVLFAGHLYFEDDEIKSIQHYTYEWKTTNSKNENNSVINVKENGRHTYLKQLSSKTWEEIIGLSKAISQRKSPTQVDVLDGQLLVPGIINAEEGSEDLDSENRAINEESYLLDRKNAIDENESINIIKVYAVDTDFNDGLDGFSLVVEINQNKAKPYYFVHKIKNLSFQSLNGLTIQASTFSQGNFGIIYTIEHTDESKKALQAKSGVYSLYFHVQKTMRDDKQTVNYFFNPQSHQLEKNLKPEIGFIAHKLLSSLHGELFWPVNNFPHGHKYFEAKSLFSGKIVRPTEIGLELTRPEIVEEYVSFSAQDGPWRVKKRGKWSKLNSFLEEIQNEGTQDYATSVFADLEELLEKISSSSEHAYQVILTGSETKNYVQKTIAGQWLHGGYKSSRKNWSYDNPQLSFYHMDPSASIDQEALQTNLNAMLDATLRGEKPVLLVDLSDLLANIFPDEGKTKRPYKIKVPKHQNESRQESEDTQALDELLSQGNSSEKFKFITPSILYMLASDGQNLDLDDFRMKSLSQVSILLVGTEEEWEEIKHKVNYQEKGAGLLKHFKTYTLETPSLEQRRNLLLKVFEKKARMFHSIEYDTTGIYRRHHELTQEQVRNKVIDYAVTRSQSLAVEKDEDSFVGFVKLLNKFKQYLDRPNELNEDGSLVISKNYIENVMRDLYNLPINLQALKKDDPLKILSQKDAILKLHEAGYYGNFDIKKRIIDGILGQTNSGDQKTIPASFILFGEKGSGKTQLFKSLVKMLKLKTYTFNGGKAVNEDAQVFEINLGDITGGLNKGDGGNMSVKELLEELDTFLMLPKGRRGFILLDDAHLTDHNVRSEIFSKVRGLFEAKNGKYKGIPVRNLSLFMTFNPTEDKEKIKKITDKSVPTPMELAVATFYHDGSKVDESFFNRWGELIQLNVFSKQAKGDELANKMDETSKSYFNMNNMYFTLSNQVINGIVQQFPELNARDFLSYSVKTLERIVREKEFSEDQNISMLIPKWRLNSDGPNQWMDDLFSSNERSGLDLEAFIKERYMAKSINKDVEGVGLFLEMIIENFRMNIYEELTDGVNSSLSMVNDKLFQQKLLSPTLHAIKTHLAKYPKLPLKELAVNGIKIKQGLGLPRYVNVDQVFDKLSVEHSKRYFPTIFYQAKSGQNLASYLTGGNNNLQTTVSRKELIPKWTHKLKSWTMKFLKRNLYIDNQTEITQENLSKWAESLPPHGPVFDRKWAYDMAEEYTQVFWDDFFSRKYIENNQPEDYAPATTYDVTRLYLYLLDKAITQLPWDEVALFLINTLDGLGQDISLATFPGVSHWLFYYNKSLIRPSSKDRIFERIKSYLVNIGEWDADEQSRMEKEFSKKVNDLFKQ